MTERLNIYSYVGGNPVSLVDPSGTICLSPTVIGAIAGGIGGSVTGAIVGGVAGAVGSDGLGTIPGAIAGALIGVYPGAVAGAVSVNGTGSAITSGLFNSDGTGSGVAGNVLGSVVSFGTQSSLGNAGAQALGNGVAGAYSGVAAIGGLAGLGVGTAAGTIGGLVTAGVAAGLNALNSCGCGH